MNEFDFSGRRALVVGAGGLGAAIAAGFAAHGAAVAAPTWTASGPPALAARARDGRRRRPPRASPSTSPTRRSVRAMVAAAVRALGGLDVLVNAAGVTVRKRAEDLAPDEWRRILDVNATGTFLCCQAAGAHMAQAGGGAIVNLSSVRGRYGATFGQAEYSASKGAVDALTRSLAAQWAELGIRVNAVAPTFVETDLTRAVLADETVRRRRCARASRWDAGARPPTSSARCCSSPRRRPRFVTGQILYVDGGLTARV